MRAAEIMSVPPVTCPSNETLDVAARAMWDHDIGAIPIVNDKGKLVGMLTDRDICMAAYTQGQNIDQIPIHTVMARTVFSATPDDELVEIEDLMAAHQVRRVPIVDPAGKPIGMVSLNDLARGAVQTAARQKIGIAKVVQTLASICQPRSQPQQAA